MPNWCFNSAILRHKDEEKIREAFQALKEEKLFEYFAPMPEDVKASTKENKPLEKKDDGNGFQMPLWWTWCINNWGTKWDICHPYTSDDEPFFDGEEWVMTFTFSTAWAPPIEAFVAAEEHGFHSVLLYEEGGVGFCGVYETGEGDQSVDYDNVNSQDDVPAKVEEAFHIWEQIQDSRALWAEQENEVETATE